MKIDLHCHSRFSSRPSTWLLKKIGCAESYTEPIELYRIAKERGMDYVTITDHNKIGGALEIAHLPDTFIGCEFTTYFPEDGCKLHVLAYDITPEQFERTEQLRENVYDMVAYFQEEGIFHALAHPFYAVNDRLTVEHFEKCLLLFKVMELNGYASEAVNDSLKQIANSLIPEDIEHLERVHGITPNFDEPWVKCFLGGSDDHSSLHLAHIHTEVPGALDLRDFWTGVLSQRARVEFQRPSTPVFMAHHLYGVAYQFYLEKFALHRAPDHNLLMRFLDRLLSNRQRRDPRVWTRIYSSWREKRGRRRPAPGKRAQIMELLQYEAQKMITADPAAKPILENVNGDGLDDDKRLFHFVSNIGDRMLGHLATHSAERLTKANPFDLFHTIGSGGALYTLVAPYFVSYGQYAKDRQIAEECSRRLLDSSPQRRETRVGHFTDTLDDVNGVARTLQKQAEMARDTGKDLTLIACTDNEDRPEYQNGTRYFRSIETLELPEYEEQKIYIPPVLQMMQFAYDRNFTHIHSATPGPVGLAGLAAARILKRPFFTTYHTSMPQYALQLTDDPAIEELTWRFMLWFYDQSDVIFSPSYATAEELVARGIAKEKMLIMPRGVDAERFNPDNRSDNLQLPEGKRLLYLGRISREKSLPLLARAFRHIHKKHPDAVLVMVGDGPYRKEMEKELQGLPAHFTGYLDGEELLAAYTQSDLFVFPSTTDTFGNVVLEAQASGLPVLVTDKGGPHENVIDGETGVVVPGENERALVTAVNELLDHPERLRMMRQAARRYAEARSLDKAFEEFWKLYNHPEKLASRNSGKVEEDPFRAEKAMEARSFSLSPEEAVAQSL